MANTVPYNKEFVDELSKQAEMMCKANLMKVNPFINMSEVERLITDPQKIDDWWSAEARHWMGL